MKNSFQKTLIHSCGIFTWIACLMLFFLGGLILPAFAGGLSMGMNLNSVEDWTTDHVFVDVFKKSRDWVTRNADGSGPWDSEKERYIPRDDVGWPTQVPFTPPDGGPTQIVHTLVTVVKGGTYALYFEGRGDFIVGGSGMGYQAVAANTPGEKTVPVEVVLDDDGQGSIWIQIQSTDASDYLRNFRMITPGFDAASLSDPFYPEYKSKLSDFSLLRFMDWGRTNASPVRSWRDRTRPDHNTQCRESGVALEFMIQLANDLNKNLWICIPHMADDEFVEKTARMLKNTVSWGLKIYVEYSNETWNTAYPFGGRGIGQTDWVQDQGVAMGLDSDRWRAGQKYVAYRSARIWRIFEIIFGTQSADRLVKVMGTQSHSTAITTARMEALQDSAINPFAVAPDVLAVAPYFGGGVADDLVAEGVVDSITVSEILSRAAAHLRGDVLTDMANQKQQADAYDLWLLTYEGGQHLVGTLGNENDQALTDKLIAANRDFGMADLYVEYLDALNDAGVAVFCNFSFISEPSKWGSWGVLESMNQEIGTAPKYQALMDWMTDNASSNLAPKARAPEDIVATDTDGDGKEPVSLDGTRSRDLDGNLVHYAWTVSGAEIATGSTAIVSLPVGTHAFELEVVDNAGATDRKSFQVVIASCGAASKDFLESDFTGVAPANHTPWTLSKNVAPGISYAGWTLGSGARASTRDDVFAYFIDNGADLSTLAKAVAADQYVSVRLGPEAGYVLDLSGAPVQLTVRRCDNHGGHRYAVFSSINGFEVGQELFVSESFDSWRTEDVVLEFNLPVDGFANIPGPVEFRIYPFEAQYYGKETSVAGFVLHGAIHASVPL